jgi:hypothetical protein
VNKDLECININWKSLGAHLASLSDVEQSVFFKAFAREMNDYPTVHQRDMQLTYIREHDKDGLNNEEREVYAYLGWDGKE